jgi:hypothetical protein
VCFSVAFSFSDVIDRKDELMAPRKRTPLRVVESDASRKAPARKRAPVRKATPKSVADAAASGDHRQLLVALAARVAKALDDPTTSGAPFAALVKQARDLADAIAAIDQAADAAETLSGSKSVIATTPDEAWDESMI